jgi:protein required for attachment to host cells
MDIVWILIADAARARILSAEGRNGQALTDLEALVHGESRQPDQALSSDRPGRGWANAGGDARHAMDPPSDPAAVERERFAHQLAARLKSAHHEGRFQHLVIVAAPALLGALRDEIDPVVARCVSHEIAKNVVKVEDLVALRGHLPDYLY